MKLIQLRDYQLQAITKVREQWRLGNRRTIASLPTGSGKCAEPGTYVWSGGLRTFGSLRDEGAEMIQTPRGLRRVLGWHDDGVRWGRQLTTDCGFQVSGTDDHRVWARTVDGVEDWRKLSELKGDEYVAIARGVADWGSCEIEQADAELLGLLVADACFQERGFTSALDLTKHPSTVRAVAPRMLAWADACRREAGRAHEGAIVYTERSALSLSARVYSLGLNDWLHRRFGLAAAKSHERCVPDKVMRGTRSTVSAFIRGYFAGDGDASANIEATSTSRLLLDQVQALLLGLGVWSSIRPRRSPGRPAWRVVVRDIDAFFDNVGLPDWCPPDKRKAFESLRVKKRNTNLDVVPGVGSLIRAMGRDVPRKHKRDDAWRYADAYYSGKKMPSYAALRELVDGCEVDSDARRECQRLIEQHYAWAKIAMVEPKLAHRIDCEVEEEHCYVGNGMVNHNTWIFVFIVHMVRANGLKCLILVNTDELVLQTKEKLAKIGIQCGIVKASKNEIHKDVVVASIQTISRDDRLLSIAPNEFMVVITDECHLANAFSYQKVLQYFQDSWHLGVTATPFRGDKKSLEAGGWHSIAFYYSIEDAIRDGWLAPVEFIRVNTDVSLDGVAKGKRLGENDFVAKQLEKAINTPERNQKIVEATLRHIPGQKTLAFCVSVRHTVDLANSFRSYGIDARAVYGSMKAKLRRELIRAHRNHEFLILCNCELLTTGYDDESLRALIMARPTKSKVLYLQELGRGLRKSPGKTKLTVLDVVDVASKHTIAVGNELVKLRSEIENAKSRAGKAGPSLEEEKNRDRSAMEAVEYATQLVDSRGVPLSRDLVLDPAQG